MSLPITPTDEDDRTVTLVTRAVIPMLLASAVTALVLVAVHAEALDGPRESRSMPPPTPYSEMHARVQEAPGEPEPQPPTF
jgi:hypothetical protein